MSYAVVSSSGLGLLFAWSLLMGTASAQKTDVDCQKWKDGSTSIQGEEIIETFECIFPEIEGVKDRENKERQRLNDVQDVLKQLTKLQNEQQESLDQALQTIEVLEASIGALQDKLKIVSDRLPPEESIIVVDDERGCPAGWIDVAEEAPQLFAGRMVVAAGFFEERVPRRFHDKGGIEAVILKEEHMPKHSHEIEDPGHSHRSLWLGDIVEGGSIGFPGKRGEIGEAVKTGHNTTRIMIQETGGDQSHNNMPPYIALYFCKKN